VARARALVLRYGWHATAYQILNPGLTFWFSRRHDAVIGYVVAGVAPGMRVVAGAPVCPDDALRTVVDEFESDARCDGQTVCYFGAETRLATTLRPLATHSMIVLGAQPAWRPETWPTMIATHASVRAQLHRAANKGVIVRHWASGRARRHPALEACLHQWLSTRGLPPLHFLVEPETLGQLEDRLVFVAERAGTPVGFVVASPVVGRRGWLIEQFVRGNEAPNGTAECMIDAAIRWMAEHDARYVTLGLAPLSRRAGVDDRDTALWLRGVLGWVRAHGRRFYNFDGLDAFKAKFHPEHWEPVYAIANEPTISFDTLYAIAAAFTNGHPIVTAAGGIGKAMRQEWRWLRQRV